MSDLYLELTARIPVVADKTYLGKARMEDAQKRTGLSNERIAQQIPMSEKTWRRWKEDGTVPTAALPAVAKALRLELREMNPAAAEQDVAPHEWAQMMERLDRIERAIHLLVARAGSDAQESTSE